MNTKLLVNLLGADESSFRRYIEQLEQACLGPGVDIKLNAEIITNSREKARVLGIDLQNSDPEDLYGQLLIKLESDDEKLKKSLGLEDTSPAKTAKNIAKIAHKLSANELSLSLTSAGVKRILKAVPPRKTMKMLKFRSLDSVIKRVDSRLLYLAACMVEDSSWHSQVHAKMRRLDAKDIRWQRVNCIVMPMKWFDRLEEYCQGKGAYISNLETGVVCVLPVINTDRKGSAVLSTGLLLQALQNVSIKSLPYRREAFSQGYDMILPEIAHGVGHELVSIHGLEPSWRVVHELMGTGYLSIGSSEIEFIVDEMSWQSVEMKLASIVPEIDFWVGTHYLGVNTDKKPLSLHIMDVAHSLVSVSDYSEQSISHLESSLWNELQLRYLQQDVLNNFLKRQLTVAGDTQDVLI